MVLLNKCFASAFLAAVNQKFPMNNFKYKGVTNDCRAYKEYIKNGIKNVQYRLSQAIHK